MSSNIFEAAASGDITYLKQHVHELGTKNERDWTALHFAARYGQAEVAEYLTQRNAGDLEAVNSEGKTPLQLAQFWGSDHVVKILQQVGQPKALAGPFPPNRSHFFGGNHLNRWYRSDKAILGRLVRAPTSRFIVFSNLDILMSKDGLYYANFNELAFIIEQFDKETFGAEFTLVFLGIDEAGGKGEDGISYWAVDITPRGAYKDEFERLNKEFEAKEAKFSPARPKAFLLNKKDASIVAQARAMVDWNARNQFCAACGNKTISDEAGHKRVCPPQPTSGAAEPCISRNGVQNIAYPRTDPVIIVCIIHPYEDKVLLGRQASWPKGMHSCIAGFVEAGESVEEAVRREACEETGIAVDHVYFHSSQPWPFPNSLMLGFIAEGKTTNIKLEDKELDAAGWFSRSDVLLMLKGEHETVTLPPRSSIAYQLIKCWAIDKEWSNRNLNPKM
ncbi:Peroxisomal NADH pyrophosphatase nudt12 [Apophysomyces ossiformis]|uniref:NAD-capped RNA hydrolase NUDT12 n=1 Tax=Apophysomyces ossiformis TaxID=679940 RepID=A0A8H7EP87_9FUNG|nr:Peroxisomal NADH pyrophosphatase nudt12 [Apophysomyces ossiformis]